MPLKIVRNDLTKMRCDAIVNTANPKPVVGDGCDRAVYNAAGYEKLLSEREKIGEKNFGDVFLTPGFSLPAKYIIHAVSPFYKEGDENGEQLLRDCYRKSLYLAEREGFESIAFPLISTGSCGFSREDSMRVAISEISTYLCGRDITVYVVVFDKKSTSLGERLFPELEEYIDDNYVEEGLENEYPVASASYRRAGLFSSPARLGALLSAKAPALNKSAEMPLPWAVFEEEAMADIGAENDVSYVEVDNRALNERLKHTSDTFTEYLLYLIESKGMTNAEVYRGALVDKRTFSKIKGDPFYHPQKMTALCLCMGAKLNLDQTTDLLSRAGYALSPCDKTDIIFKYFIENGIYDMIELDIQLEEHGLPCLIA